MNATADTPPARAPRLSMSTVVCAVEGGARVVLWLFIKEFIQAHLVRPGVPVSYIPSVYRTDLVASQSGSSVVSCVRSLS